MTPITPMKAIRAKCLECSNGSTHEVRHCAIKDCALWPMRLGRNPFRPKRVITDEEKAVMVARLKGRWSS